MPPKLRVVTDTRGGRAEEHLRLPKFHKVSHKIDVNDHSACCDTPRNDVIQVPMDQVVVPALKPTRLGFTVGVNVIQGARTTMEDRHRINVIDGHGPYRGFFAVYDGHGGEESAHYAHKNLHVYVQEAIRDQARELQFDAMSTKYTLPANGRNKSNGGGGGSSGGLTVNVNTGPDAQLPFANVDYQRALRESFDRMEDFILNCARQIGFRDGSTACTVCLVGDAVYCANTGDSRAVMCRNGLAFDLSSDHKPLNENEQKRIREAGGDVHPVLLERPAFCCFPAKQIPQGAPRVWPGGMSVARAFGDIDFKDPRRGKIPKAGVLIHSPDITVTPLTQLDQFVIIASDGLWDCFTSQKACDFVLDLVNNQKQIDPAQIARELAAKAFKMGSEDNVSVVLIFFNRFPSNPTSSDYD